MDTLLRLLLGQIGPLLRLIFKTLTDAGSFDHLLDLARQAVLNAEGTIGKDGSEKRQAAYAAIVAELAAAGKVIIPILVNLAIELCVAALKAEMAKNNRRLNHA